MADAGNQTLNDDDLSQISGWNRQQIAEFVENLVLSGKFDN